MIKMPLTINGVDFSPLTARLGYSIVYEDRKGGNSMTMQNGDEYQDIITRRPNLTWRLDSLKNDDLQSLLAAINAAIYVPVEYFDTESGMTKTAMFHGTISVQEVGAIGPGGAYYRFKAPVLSMRAR